MNELPSMWRTELFHPQGVHFPLALLTIGVLFYFLSFIKNKHLSFLKPASLVLTGIGVIGAWLSVYTGNLAYQIIIRDLCDPTMVKDHEVNAMVSTYIFSAGFVLFGITSFKKVKPVLNKILHAFIIVLFTGGLSFLLYTGHLGAGIVYQQAGAVHVPGEDCSEFE